MRPSYTGALRGVGAGGELAQEGLAVALGEGRGRDGLHSAFREDDGAPRAALRETLPVVVIGMFPLDLKKPQDADNALHLTIVRRTTVNHRAGNVAEMPVPEAPNGVVPHGWFAPRLQGTQQPGA